MKKNEKKETQFTIYTVDEKNEDLKALTFFENVEDVANYLEVSNWSVYKIIQGIRKTFINGQEIKVIKDIF